MARPRIVGLRFAAAAFVLAAATIPAAAQDISGTFGSGTGLTERVLQLVALVIVLSLVSSILIAWWRYPDDSAGCCHSNGHVTHPVSVHG